MLFDILCNCIGFQVVDDFHLQVSGLLGFFTRFGVFNRFAFSHHQDLGLFLASTAAFQRFLLLFNGYLGGKEGVVQLDGALERVLVVTLAHHVTQFIDHFPYGLVTLVPQLSLYLGGGKGALGSREQVHGHEPVTVWQVGMLHDRARTQRLARLATLAFVSLLVFQPIMLLTITTTAGNSHLVSLLFEFFPTGFLIGVIYSKIQDIHSLKYYMCSECKYNEYL